MSHLEDSKTKSGRNRIAEARRKAELGFMENEPKSEKIKERFYRKPYANLRRENK